MRFCFKALSPLCGEGLRSRCSRPALSRSRPGLDASARSLPDPPSPNPEPSGSAAWSPALGSCRAADPLPAWGLVVSRSVRASLGSVEDLAPVPPLRESTAALCVLSGVREPWLAPLLAPGWWWCSGDPDCTAGSSPARKGRLCQEQPGLTGLVHGPRHAGELQVLRPPRHLGLRDQVARSSSLTHGGPPAVLLLEKTQQLVAVVSREPSSRGSCLGWALGRQVGKRRRVGCYPSVSFPSASGHGKRRQRTGSTCTVFAGRCFASCWCGLCSDAK